MPEPTKTVMRVNETYVPVGERTYRHHIPVASSTPHQLRDQTSILSGRLNQIRWLKPTRRSDASCCKIDHREPLQSGRFLKEMEWRLNLLCEYVQLLVIHNAGFPNFTLDGSGVPDTWSKGYMSEIQERVKWELTPPRHFRCPLPLSSG